MAGAPESPRDPDRLLRGAVAVLLVVSTGILLAPARPAVSSAAPSVLQGMICAGALAGACFVGWMFIRGRPWASTAVLLGMLLIQGVLLAGMACLNNLKYIADSVRPLAEGYLFGNMLQAARWLGMPTRSLPSCLLSIGVTLGVFLVLPTVVTVRQLLRSPPESRAWVQDMAFILVCSTFIWNAAMIGLTLRPFTLGYLW